MADEPYKQTLPGLDLTIEKATERTPDTRRYHLFLDGEIVASYRKLHAAQDEFRRLRDQSGWKPPEKAELPSEEKLARDRELMQHTAHME
jgi:hypothetical protein